MKSFWLLARWGFLAVYGLAVLAGPAWAQTEFKIALQKKYSAYTVSCNTCHVSGEEKKVRNDFGKLFVKELDGKNVTKRLAAVKALETEDPARIKVRDDVTAEFLAALAKIEGASGPGGQTYGQLLKAGKVEGLTPKE